MLDGLFKARMVGDPRYSRYIIRDDTKPGRDRFWTGFKWTKNVANALLYADIGDVAKTVFKMTTAYLSRKFRPRKYHVTLEITVFGPDHVTKEQVEDYIRRAMIMGLTYEDNGTGPTPDTLVLARIPVVDLQPAS